MTTNGIVKQIIGDFSLLNSSPFAKLLDSCIKSRSVRDARRVHARITKTQFAYEVFIQNRLIDAYGKCGFLNDARKVFDKMPERNTFSWNSIISTLMKSGFPDEGARLFAAMPQPDQCSWNSIIAGFAQRERFEEALECFVMMHRKGFVMNEYTFGSCLSACSGLKDLKMGTQVHGLILKSQFSLDVYMGTALIDMYSKCGFVNSAQRVFDEMREKNVVSWNSLIACYEQNGPAKEALYVFVRMMESGYEPDEVTLASVVSACASLAAAKQGLEIHACVVKCDKLRNDVILSNALVDMYAKCGRIYEARCVFDRMPLRNVVSETSMVSGYAKAASTAAARSMFITMTERNVVSWNALIAGYTQNGENEEALVLFRMLKREGICPTHYTFGNLLNACSNLADLQLGRQAHTHVLKHGYRFQYGEEPDVFVGNALLDMYMKCGSVVEACQVFEKMVEKDNVSWNAMIVGYAQNGYGIEALGLFKEMLAVGEKPDNVTMIGALCACSHAGLVEEGRHYFFSMTKEYGLEPSKDHFTCMVDLLGRAGCLDEAKNLIETMPMQPDAVIWGSLLGACKVHHNITIGEYAAAKLMEIDCTNSGPYVLLSNIYAELGRWKDVVRVRKVMKHQGVVKQPGCSWIEILGRVHVFMVKDKRHSQRHEIYSLLKMLSKQMKLAGDVPDPGGSEVLDPQADAEVSSAEVAVRT
ncbi:pentatricopeptide repeat-containing protein At2g13600 isoform X2 [Euphorbia lathyris]|uniref:pentatricopeptide repeat-containing protein At2g13600 isoform X2 n=1 Tax=Euphorbia lathyris TaxID=212925 RepID=UPI0033143534